MTIASGGTIDVPPECPVCGSPYMSYVRHVPTRRTKRDIPLHACLSCRSFSNPSGYREDLVQLQRDLEFHKSIEDRNRRATRTLFQALRDRGIAISRIVEIGAGIGTLLSVAGELGSTGIGYDINDLTTSYGRQKHNLDLRSEFWTSKTDTGPFDVMLCISVLEHVDRPRGLMAEMAEACRRERAALFISVPLLDEDKWPFILDPTPTRQGTPFFDNDVHVTHFSSLGLEKAMWEHGAAKVDWLREGLWHGTVARF